MKTLIVPDIHNNYVKSEAIIRKVNPDHIIFLGDYFDSFGDTFDLESVTQTARWLQWSTEQTNRLHLFGNHDIWYSHHSVPPNCGGNTYGKAAWINTYFKNWDKLKFHCWLDDWLCTHAGLTDVIYKEYREHGVSVLDLMNEIELKARHHPLVNLVGKRRCGDGDAGGILWCDYHEFKDIDGVKQIFGHTHNDKVRYNENHICLDTDSHYAIYEKGIMKICDSGTDKIIEI